ncbi:serine hydrolase [cf. Phormidesmis sp. LEGE 11477]|uniref:serine hydrolase n=1 Tax=cf. Phormidesmis sp. LEGE 11477 TaxID=1828680 RepID=UPI0018820448|nr:serine hydrolase [cf. Phormidesmis sp. LEGE 11477]MBE9061187.1 serine hydrolase [cf. Phormidesmis sp. LEGE 11477]
MSGFWYTAAIATTASALFILTGELATPLETMLSRQSAFGSNEERSKHKAAPNDATGSTLAARNVLIEQNADRANFDQAVALARQAVDAYQAAQTADTPAASLAFTRQERVLWHSSLQKLSTISRDALIYQQVNDKKAHYKTLLATAEQKVLAADSAFLADIIKAAQISPAAVHITLCQIDLPPNLSEPYPSPLNSSPSSSAAIDISTQAAQSGYSADWCRHYQGEQLLASPASLIKLPIAIAVLDKIHAENLGPNSKLYIDPQNFTENALGATIEVDQEYPLLQVMDRMISESNNIATNQLIDYVGRGAINKTLIDQGYTNTFVDHKLAGDRILPPNPGTQSNRITTDDVTTMMVNTYRLTHPGDEKLLQALQTQKDQELGYRALQEVGPAVEWIGEKTGQNERMLGTTLVMKIDAERYALTVAINHSADAIALRELIKGVANHLIENGPIATEPIVTEFDQAEIGSPPAQSIARSAVKSTTQFTRRSRARSL